MSHPPKEHITLKPLEDHLYTKELETDWDWNMAGSKTLKAYINKKLEVKANIFFWIIVKDKPAGLFGLMPHEENSWETSIFISQEYRGTDLLTIIYHSSIQAFKNMEIPPYASVHIDNTRSLKAHDRMLDHEGTILWEEGRDRYAKIYTLTHMRPNQYSELLVKEFESLKPKLAR